MPLLGLYQGKSLELSPSALYQSERQLLLAVGRLDAQKGFDWLIEAFSNLADKHPDWDLVILGEGSLRTTLEEQVARVGFRAPYFSPWPGWQYR